MPVYKKTRAFPGFFTHTRRLSQRSYAYAAVGFVKYNLAVNQSENCEVASQTDILARTETGSALTDDDAAGGYIFTTERLDT